MVVDNLNDPGEGGSIIFSDARSARRDLYMFHHAVYSVKVSLSSNFDPIFITLRYKNNNDNFSSAHSN